MGNLNGKKYNLVLSFLFLNIQESQNKMNIVESLLPNGQDNVILVICFTEHWLRDDISKMA